MTPTATTFLILSILIVWGGLAASLTLLSRRPERADFPPGGLDDHREDDAPVIRDT